MECIMNVFYDYEYYNYLLSDLLRNDELVHV